MTNPNEPNAIALLRRGAYVPDAADCDAILQAYDAIVAERDAAVRERDVLRERADQFEVGMVEAVQRLAACAEIITRFDNVLSTVRDHLPLCVNDGEFADHSQEMVDRELVTLRAAVAAETQATPHTGGTDA
jgi:hypothetical protein